MSIDAQSVHLNLDRVRLLDEHLYQAYQQAQRSPMDQEQTGLRSRIRKMQRERATLLSGLLAN